MRVGKRMEGGAQRHIKGEWMYGRWYGRKKEQRRGARKRASALTSSKIDPPI